MLRMRPYCGGELGLPCLPRYCKKQIQVKLCVANSLKLWKLLKIYSLCCMNSLAPDSKLSPKLLSATNFHNPSLCNIDYAQIRSLKTKRGLTWLNFPAEATGAQQQAQR